ncbi:MAG: transposase [Anaerolineae bacterium]
MSRKKKWTPDFKARIVLEVLSHEKSQAEACQEYRVSKPVLELWTETLLSRASQVFEEDTGREEVEAKVADLERMIGRLTMENEPPTPNIPIDAIRTWSKT